MSSPAPNGRTRLLAVYTFSGLLVGCAGPSASTEDCIAVVDRITALELADLGLRDPVLLERWTNAFHKSLRAELTTCANGHTLLPDARKCIADARTTTELIDDCLR